MRFTPPRMSRTLLVPVLVLLLGIAAIASITALQKEANDSAEAQLKLARVENALNALQVAPFRAVPALGGSPTIARGLMVGGKREIDQTLADLRRNSPPSQLRRTAAPLRANYATLDRVYTLGARGEFTDELTRLAARSLGQAEVVARQIHLADAAYEQRAETAHLRATIGSIGVILLLVAGFGLIYRRSVRARTTAERLVIENDRLLGLSRVEALTDPLTALPNRRALRHDLAATVDGHGAAEAQMLVLLDLDGFKLYNDTFGHPAGDALLTRLGARLAAATSGRGRPYRMGGDEFCVLARAQTDDGEVLLADIATALSEAGEAFDIGCSFGVARIPSEAATAEEALRLADKRMYEQKVGHSSPSRQSTDVLLTVLSEHSPKLHDHLSRVAALSEAVSRSGGLPELDIQWIRLAAELHDVGKVAIPVTVLDKPGPLSAEEWNFIKGHPAIGERIVRSAPSLAPAAQLVRSSHERYDGAGYPDGLRAEQIELGARIIAICNSYDAMISHRPYRPSRTHDEALAELRRCSGTQFDPAMVELFCSTVPSPLSALVETAAG